jgi:hypothetical protein
MSGACALGGYEMTRHVSFEELTPAQRTSVALIQIEVAKEAGDWNRATERSAAALVKQLPPEIAPEQCVRETDWCDADYWTAEGTPIRLSELPKSSENLTSAQARAIFECFSQKIAGNLSCGHAALHFWQTVLYALGREGTLSSIQKNLVVWLCIAMRRRPLPSLWSAQFVLENIDNPTMVRLVIGANIWSQLHYQERFTDAFAETAEWRNLIKPPSQQIRLLAVGYSETIAVMLAKVAADADHRIIAYVPDLKELGRDRPAHEYYREQVARHLPDMSKIDIRAIASADAGRVALEHKIDLVLLNSKIISATNCNTTRIVESAACIRIVRQVRRATGRWDPPPIVVAGGLFKIWPARLYDEYFKGVNTNTEEIGPADDEALRGDEVTLIVTDIGCLPPLDLRSLPDIAYRLNVGNFATATALHLFQTDSQNNDLVDRPSGGTASAYSLRVNNNKFPLATEPDCIILSTIDEANKNRSSGHEASAKKVPTVLGRQQRSDVERAIKDAKLYFEELLADDLWYRQYQGQYIAISAHPRAYVTASSLDSLRQQPGYGELGIWYRCRVDRDAEGRAIDVSTRTRLLARG